jgi:hypothetical protein
MCERSNRFRFSVVFIAISKLVAALLLLLLVLLLLLLFLNYSYTYIHSYVSIHTFIRISTYKPYAAIIVIGASPPKLKKVMSIVDYQRRIVHIMNQ